MIRSVSFDLETWLFTEGNKAPPAVCGSFGEEHGETRLQTPAQVWESLRLLLREPGLTIVGVNVAYDFAITCAEDPTLIPLVFDFYNRSGRVEDGGPFDVPIALALDGIARGKLLADPHTGAPLKSIRSDGSEGGRAERYSLALALKLLTGRVDAKTNDTWRMRYGELSAISIDQWPEVARQYPRDDARNTIDCRKVILARAASEGNQQFYGLGNVWCYRPATRTYETPYGWTHHIHQARAAFAMQLAAVNGIRADPQAVEALATKAADEHARTLELLQREGLTRLEGDELKKNGAAIKSRVAIAYGTDPLSKCATCSGAGKVPSPKTKKPIQCKSCSATGLEIADSVPRTPTEGISADRLTLEESGDETLEQLAEADAKTHETYIPFLRKAASHPVCIEFNSLLTSGRASWGILQTLPKKPGVRECVIPAKGFRFVSVDYSALEFATLGQVALWTVGYSKIVEALNSDTDPHSLLGSKMIGCSYDQFIAALKDPATKDNYKSFRFGTKSGNFGFGGLMGPARFAATQRRAKSFPIAGGKGFHGSVCRVLGRESEQGCGSEKLTEWKRRPIAPICRQCVEVSAELKAGWLETWPEMADYHAWIQTLPGVSDGEGLIISPGTGFIRGGLTASEAANHPFQHLASIGAKHALWRATQEMYDRRCNSPLFGSRVAVFAHDEILAQVPIECDHEASHRLAKVMIESMRVFTPDVKIKAEPALMDRWYKNAEPVYSADGRLIPWEPKS
jgi:hypothetical protein